MRIQIAALSIAVLLPAALAPAAGITYSPTDIHWQQIGGDDFNGTTLDTSKWGYNYPWSDHHNHAAYWAPSHVSVHDGYLDLMATPGIPAGKPSTQGSLYLSYTSGAVYSKQSYNQNNLYIDVRMQTPGDTGTWPAIWMLGNGWPPEVDIMENPVSTTAHSNPVQSFNQTFHGDDAGADHSFEKISSSPTLNTAFHNYGMSWDKSANSLSFYFDGVISYTVNNPLDKNGQPLLSSADNFANMYLLLDLAVGGWADSDGSTSNNSVITDGFVRADMLIDYVHIYTYNANASLVTTPEPASLSLLGAGALLLLRRRRGC